MKKTVAALALSAILIPAAVIAGSYYGDRGEQRAERMAEHLQLNEQQRAEMQNIFAEQREQRRAMRKEMRSQTQERIGKVLTPEQQAKWQEHRENRKQRACEHRGKGHKGYRHGHHGRGEGPRYERDDA